MSFLATIKAKIGTDAFSRLERVAGNEVALAKQMQLVACRGESVTAVATPKGQKQVCAWRIPAIWTDLLPESHTNDLSATGH